MTELSLTISLICLYLTFKLVMKQEYHENQTKRQLDLMRNEILGHQVKMLNDFVEIVVKENKKKEVK